MYFGQRCLNPPPPLFQQFVKIVCVSPLYNIPDAVNCYGRMEKAQHPTCSIFTRICLLKVGLHYERLFQRLKSLINEPKRRRNYVREKDIFHSHYERFISGAIQLLRTFPSV